MVIVIQLHEYTKPTELHSLNSWIENELCLNKSNYLIKKEFFEKKILFYKNSFIKENLERPESILEQDIPWFQLKYLISSR